MKKSASADPIHPESRPGSVHPRGRRQVQPTPFPSASSRTCSASTAAASFGSPTRFAAAASSRIPAGRKDYILGPSIWRLSRSHDWSDMLITFSHEHLKKLAIRTGETTHLAVREGKQAFFIDHYAATRQLIVVSGQVGEFVPLYCTAHGKALLADFGSEELKAILGPGPYQGYTPTTITTLKQLASECARIKADRLRRRRGGVRGGRALPGRSGPRPRRRRRRLGGDLCPDRPLPPRARRHRRAPGLRGRRRDQRRPQRGSRRIETAGARGCRRGSPRPDASAASTSGRSTTLPSSTSASATPKPITSGRAASLRATGWAATCSIRRRSILTSSRFSIESSARAPAARARRARVPGRRFRAPCCPMRAGGCSDVVDSSPARSSPSIPPRSSSTASSTRTLFPPTLLCAVLRRVRRQTLGARRFRARSARPHSRERSVARDSPGDRCRHPACSFSLRSRASS